MNMNELGKAGEYYKKAIEVNPFYPLAYVNIGIWFNLLGQYPEAELSFLFAINLNPTDARFYTAYAEFLTAQGRFTEAA